MKHTFVIINKQDLSQSKRFTKAKDAAIFLLGRRIENYCILFDFVQIIVPVSYEINAIQRQLEEAERDADN